MTYIPPRGVQEEGWRTQEKSNGSTEMTRVMRRKMNKISHRITAVCAVIEGKARVWDPFFISNLQHEINHSIALSLSKSIMRHKIGISMIFGKLSSAPRFGFDI